MRTTLARFVALLLTATLLALSGGLAWRTSTSPYPSASGDTAMRLVIASRAGDVVFDHAPHASIACVQCHHTSTGAMVEAGCRACHRPQGGFVPGAAQAFHAQCIGCHRGQLARREASGPAARCSGCHGAPAPSVAR